MGGIGHIGKRTHIISHRFNVDDAGDIDSAVADKNADPGFFFAHIAFLRYGGGGNQRSSGSGQQGRGSLRRTAALLHGFRNIFGTLGRTTNINTRSGGGDLVQRIRGAETMRI